MLKFAIWAVVAIVLVGGGYVFYTLRSGEELNEASPLDMAVPQAPAPEGAEGDAVVRDNLEAMDAATREEFDRQVAAMQDDVLESSDAMPAQATLAAEGDFMRRIHSVAGRALLIDQGSQKTLRFEDFETDNGPNLHIYLASDLGADDFVDLGPIKATRGNVNYAVGADVDTERYNKVLVWCVPFGILFSYADLQ